MTRAHLLALPLTAALTIPTSPQDLPPPGAMITAPDAACAADLGAPLRERGDAVVAGDPALLPRMADDFVGTGCDGAVVDPPTWARIHSAPEPGFERFGPSRVVA